MTTTKGVVLLLLVCVSGIISTVDAVEVETARRLRDRTTRNERRSKARASLSSRSMNAKRHAVMELLKGFARSGRVSATKMHALVDRMTRFEGYEHAFGSGFDSGNTNDAIKFRLLNTATDKFVEHTTADRVLKSPDGVDFSYAEMTAVSGDFWSVKDSVNRVICNGKGGDAKDLERVSGLDNYLQNNRLFDAFRDLWHNPDFGSNGKHKDHMVEMEEQLRKMLADEKAGIERLPLSEMHRGSKYYEPKQPGWWGNVGGMAGHMVNTKVTYNARSEGEWKALEFNDDHFFTCAQETYAAGHKVALIEAYGAGKDYRMLKSGVKMWDPKAKPVPPTFQRADSLDILGGPESMPTVAKVIPLVPGGSANKVPTPVVPAPVKPPADVIQVTPATAAEMKDYLVVSAPEGRLRTAYAMDGFVSHFLSDQFSAGHLRTPRLELRASCGGSKSAGMTANVMHDEDNWNCLLVENKFNQHWYACGDHRFFDHENAMNRRMLHDAIEASVHEVQAAFEVGAQGKPKPWEAVGWEAVGLKYIGSAAETGPQKLSMRQRVENTCPYFRITPKGGLETRKGGPRPPGAMKYPWGASLRATRSDKLFPAFVDAKTTVPELAQSDADFVKVHKNLAETVCEYEPTTTKHCCTVWGRSTPEFQDKSPFADKQTSFQDTMDPTNLKKRATYFNRCALEQDVRNAPKTIAQMGLHGAAGPLIAALIK